MKKITLLACSMLFAFAAFAQGQQKQRTYIASPEMMNKSESYEARRVQIMEFAGDRDYVRAHPIAIQSQPLSPNGKTAAVSPILLGRASNIFTCLRPEQNQVYANDSLDMVAFIHRHDILIHGGAASENGKYRYDVSIDGGATFNNDIGTINTLYTRPARYPNITGFNNSGTSNPLSAKLAFSGPVLNPSPDWDGHVTGLCDVVTSGTGNCTETYSLLSSSTLLQGGLCQSVTGTFWSTEFAYIAAATPGDIYVNKGVFNSGTNDIDWSRVDTVLPPHYTGFDGTATIIGPNMSFSMDGQTGWLAWLGDLNGGQDSTVNPCFIKSTDGGATWDPNTAMEVNLNSVSWVADTLRSLWTDSLGNPASSGIATCAFDYDVTVDKNDNVHMAVVIGTASGSATPNDLGYTILSSLGKFMADVYTTDGGATWDIAYIGPVLTFRGTFGVGTNPVTMDNQPQIARSSNGNMIFYSWVDSDTSVVGFGESNNIAPNLRIASMKVSAFAAREQTYPQLITDGDLIWEGRALFPTMAPEVIWNGTEYELPIVMAEMITNDPLQSTQFHYFGKDCMIDPTDLCDSDNMTLGWNVFSGSGSTPPCTVGLEEVGMNDDIVLGQSYPNPNAGEAVILFELAAVTDVRMELVNMYGQQVAILIEGNFPAGAHKVVANTKELATGVYFYNLHANGRVLSKKMVVTK